MLKLPRHIKLYVVNEIQHLDFVEEVKELVYEFDCDSSAEADDIIYDFVQAHNIEQYCTEVEELPVPEQDQMAVYEALVDCVESSMGEGFIEDAEYNFLLDWLAEHFSAKVN